MIELLNKETADLHPWHTYRASFEIHNSFHVWGSWIRRVPLFMWVTRGGRGEVSPYSFSKTGKKCPNVEKKCPDCGFLWVIFTSFHAKNRRLFPCGTFLSPNACECLSKRLISRKLPCLKKFLITRLLLSALNLLYQTYSC